MIVLKQMLVFLIMIIFGLLARRSGIITKANQSQFSAMVINLACPSLILSSAMTSNERISIGEIGVIFGVLCLLIAIVLLLSWLVPIVMKYPKEEHATVNTMFWCTNITFIGLPLVQGLYGTAAVIYVTFAIMLVNTLFYSYGVILISRGSEKKQKFSPKSLLTPGMLSCIAACLVYFLDFPIPDVVETSLTMVGSLTAPLAMMMIGYGLQDVNLKDMITDVRLILFTVLKMLVMPILVLLLMKQITNSTYLLATCLALVASPTGGMVAMLATLYNPKAYLSVTREVSFTTLAAVITIPVVAAAIGL